MLELWKKIRSEHRDGGVQRQQHTAGDVAGLKQMMSRNTNGWKEGPVCTAGGVEGSWQVCTLSNNGRNFVSKTSKR